MRYVVAPLIVLGVAGGIGEFLFLHSRLSALKGQMSGSVTKLELQQSALAPTDPQSIQNAQSVLTTAKNKNSKIDVNIIKTTGTKFIESAQRNPEVWPVAEQYLSYSSFLNTDLAPPLTPSTGTSKYRSAVTFIPNPNQPEHHLAYQVQFAGGYAKGDKSARLERLDNPQPEGSEFAFFIVVGVGDTIVLDGEYMRNVIIRNANVAYDGGPLVLENVYFVNCTFTSFRPTKPGIDLGKTILASTATTFSNNAASGAPGSR
jgi:hypothetical protein